MIPGPVLFARFAYPPNLLGYCGPDDSAAVGDYAGAGTADRGLTELAGRFSGAWPYLRLIAAATRIADPLDARVVGAYWIGGPLLERIGPSLLAAHLAERFERRVGGHRADLVSLAGAGARAHHNFHVFGVYPWVGLLRSGFSEEPLRVLDRCRIRWGRVLTVAGGAVTVRSRSLAWDGRVLRLGEPRTEVTRPAPGVRVREGDVAALHWDWVCHRLSPYSASMLRHYTLSQLRVVNTAARPAPVLDRGPGTRALS
ncbi:DUF6390 family protein [Actinomadura bangladeshensis]|uniref:Uncharacterized protein n=1 Tax=Actinomadura bangladeshensis TaxID=453573 RepID=A0A4R4P3D4_9ACTN|nr:DUF6390 family protein [Actinomadura bangladeshensis]TDC16144.1 hypothetical protein E1284_13425 [Actinomadura bangladeshensis]